MRSLDTAHLIRKASFSGLPAYLTCWLQPAARSASPQLGSSAMTCSARSRLGSAGACQSRHCWPRVRRGRSLGPASASASRGHSRRGRASAPLLSSSSVTAPAACSTASRAPASSRSRARDQVPLPPPFAAFAWIVKTWRITWGACSSSVAQPGARTGPHSRCVHVVSTKRTLWAFKAAIKDSGTSTSFRSRRTQQPPNCDGWFGNRKG
mmetsp:Transcript_79663/g.225285  ORF Transcript_79663/g.225285 Transcript_79663/m.225285 type:complete len:209 (+) Transcript_79663:106-732(+)